MRVSYFVYLNLNIYIFAARYLHFFASSLPLLFNDFSFVERRRNNAKLLKVILIVEITYFFHHHKIDSRERKRERKELRQLAKLAR